MTDTPEPGQVFIPSNSILEQPGQPSIPGQRQAEPPHEDHEDTVLTRYQQLREQLLDVDGLRKIPPPEPLLEGWLWLNSVVWIYGKPGSAKSLLVIDWACCIALGIPWHGRPTTRGRVLYLIAEGAQGFAQRIDAWELANSTPAGPDIRFLPIPIQLLDQTDTDAFIRLAHECRPSLIVIDTQAQTTVGADENSGRDMSRFVHNLQRLRDATGACVAVIHHEPRSGETPRGHSSIDGAADGLVRVSKEDSLVTITNPKMKDAPDQRPLALSVVPCGNSVVLSTDTTQLARAATASQLKLLTLIAARPGGINKSDLKEAAIGNETHQISRSTFHRALGDLLGSGRVHETKRGPSLIYTAASDDRQQTLDLDPDDAPDSPQNQP